MSVSDFELAATARTETGKGAMRRLRRTGMVPGVMYGAGQEAENVQVMGHYLRKQLENEAFFSHIINVNVDGKQSQAVVKALQRSPLTHEVTHIDLLRVSSTSELTMNVPLHFINEEESVGKKAGGIVSHLMMDLEIACMPKDLPEFIEVDLASVDIGESVHLSDIKLPSGVRLTTDPTEGDGDGDHTVVSIQKAAELDVEPEDDAAEEAAGADAPEEAAD